MTINERVSDERIANLIEVLEFYMPEDKSLANNESELASALRELQQYRAAAEKPIGSFHIVDQQVGGTTDYVKDGEWPIDNGELLVYAAPQVTSVPFEVPESLKDRLLTICDLVEDNDEYCQDIWNACRAAMLAAPAVQAVPGQIDLLRAHYNYGGNDFEVRAYQHGWNDCVGAAPAAQAEQLFGNTEQVEPVSQPYTLPEWLQQAHKLAELHGTSFVVFRHGEEAQCADPTKVIISFTDEGLGHHSAAPQQDAQEVKK